MKEGLIWNGLKVFLLFAFLSAPSHAWDRHQSLMPSVLSGIPEDLDRALSISFPAPCPGDDDRIYQELAQELKLNPEVSLPLSSMEGCGEGRELTPKKILLQGTSDDPDRGMDQNLPPEYDPKGYRRFMGGTRGPTSQGFRHMFFGGWNLSSPIRTFQVPAGSIGEAPERVEFLSKKAKKFLTQRKETDWQALWGTRVLAWAIHYIQDLAQPFHSDQIPHLRMVPWSSALKWPPADRFEALVRETTRTISNYHWAFEKYVYFLFQHPELNAFNECVSQPETYATADPMKFLKEESDIPHEEIPGQIALHINETSSKLAGELGSAIMGFFGTELKEPQYDLASGKNTLNYRQYAEAPELERSRKKLHEVTCKALANAILGSRALIHWAF